MNKTALFQALDQISPEHIAQALDYKPRKRLTLRRGIAFAAAAAAVLALVLSIPFLNRDNEIITAPGVITVKAYSPDSSSPAFIEKYEGIELEKDTVDFDTTRPYFSMFYNYHPGILLSVSVPEEYGDNITYQVVLPAFEGDSGQVDKYYPNDFHYERVDKWIFNNGDAIACIFISENPYDYILFILRDGEYIIGYVVVKACRKAPESDSYKYTAHMLDAVYFPAVNGKRQTISMDYVNQQIAALIGQE